MILTCLYLTGCGREEVPYLDTTQTQEQTVETGQTEAASAQFSACRGLLSAKISI